MNIWSLHGCYLKCKRKFVIDTTCLTILQTRFQFRGITTFKLQQNNDIKSLNKALRVIDLITPKATHGNNQQGHLQLIQDLLRIHSKKVPKATSVNDVCITDTRNQVLFDQVLPSFPFKDDAISEIVKLHREGLRIDVELLSYALSVCGYSGNLHCGSGLQCLAIRDGYLPNVYIGSSLISMYSKHGDLRSAYMVFEEMPVKNVVSWTALISGFAQNCESEACLEFYIQMRHSSVKPNEFTLTCVLSACVSNGSLGPGKSAHCLAIRSGFSSHVHVANASISMYCKCGDIDDAFYVFDEMRDKDIISWNSMIVGYALHGLAWKAIDLFVEMRSHKIKPDKITFLGVLSSCCHAGLLKQGDMYFKSMVEFGVEPDLGHYSCIVDLLGRAGFVEECRNFILDMPIKPNAVIWGSLLSSCRLHNNIWIGIEAGEKRLSLEPTCAVTHVQLAKLYARAEMWDQVANLWKIMKDAELKTSPGYSWIEIGNEVITFRADETNNYRLGEVFCMLENLYGQMAATHLDEFEEFDSIIAS